MWLIVVLLAILVALILIVIMDTAMKLALMITTLYNYDTKKLFIPATLTVILWAVLLLGAFNSINTALDNNAFDIMFAMIFDHSIIAQYKDVMIKPLLSAFVIGTILQSLTYYTVNINYQKITGSVRFSAKKLVKTVVKKVFKKDILTGKNNASLSEVQRGPKKLTFIRAILTSIISVIITVLVCYGLFVLGNVLSDKVLSIF